MTHADQWWCKTNSSAEAITTVKYYEVSYSWDESAEALKRTMQVPYLVASGCLRPKVTVHDLLSEGPG